jgi:DNA-binding NarL/FixJ family response regulator
MSGIKMTSLICFDDHRSFTDEIRKRFSDPARYNVTSFVSRLEFIDYCKNVKENYACKVAIIGVPDAKEQLAMIEEFTMEVKKVDPKTGLILIAAEDKMEDVKKTINFNIDAYVPRNTNSVLRIHNTVKKLISEHSINYYRKKRNTSLYILLAFFVIAIGALLFAFFRFPGYF